jgi:pimeloyl-ACP methyl ester carboxylesterase
MIGSALTGLALGLLTGLDPLTDIRSEAICATQTTAPASTPEVRLAWRDLGPADGRPVLLIAGTDQQMGQWPAALLTGLREAGHRVILYEARDVGCSTHHVDAGPVDWGAVFAAMGAGSPPPLAYDLPVLAADAVAVLDHLGLAQADIIGVAGGATVAGEVAAAHPDRVGRLVLVMANSGNPARPMPARPERMAAVPPPPSAGAEVAAVVGWRTTAWTALGAPASPALDALAREATARSWDPDGTTRAGAALLTSGDRRARLAAVAAPTLVIHGADDPLISPDAGRDVAEAIPEADFQLIPGMGHDLSPAGVEAVLAALASSPEPADGD